MNEANCLTHKSQNAFSSNLGSQFFMPYPIDSDQEEGDVLDDYSILEIIEDLNGHKNEEKNYYQSRLHVFESKSQFRQMKSQVSYRRPDGYNFNILCKKDINSFSQNMHYGDQRQQSTTNIRHKANYQININSSLFIGEEKNEINLSSVVNDNDCQEGINEGVSCNVQIKVEGEVEENISLLNTIPNQKGFIQKRVSPDKMSHYLPIHASNNHKGSLHEHFGNFPIKSLQKQGTTDLGAISTNDQTGITSQHSNTVGLNPNTRRQQLSSLHQNQQNSSRQEEIIIDERDFSANEEDTPRVENVLDLQKGTQSALLPLSLRQDALVFSKTISRQNKIIENQAFLVTCKNRKYIGQNNQMPTVVMETDSEDVATFKDKRLRASGKLKLLSSNSGINMLGEESVLNMSINFSKKGTNQLRNSQNGSSEYGAGERNPEQVDSQENNQFPNGGGTSSSNTGEHLRNSNRVNTFGPINGGVSPVGANDEASLQKSRKEESYNLPLEQLEGLLEVEEDEEERRSYSVLLKNNREQIDNGIMIELASQRSSMSNQRRQLAQQEEEKEELKGDTLSLRERDKRCDTIFSRSDQVSNFGGVYFASDEFRQHDDNDESMDNFSNYSLNSKKRKSKRSKGAMDNAYSSDDENSSDSNSPSTLKKRQTLLAKKTITFIWGMPNSKQEPNSGALKRSATQRQEQIKTEEDIKEILAAIQTLKENKIEVTYYGYSFFRKSRAKIKLSKKESKLSIKAVMKEHSKRMAIQKKETDMTIKLKHITGLLIGPQSITFQILIKKKRLEDFSLNYWSYLSIVTEERTYDLQFDAKVEFINFYIAMNQCISKIKKDFPKIVNRKFLSVHLFRMKLEHIAELQGLSMIQLFKKSLYLRAQALPEITVNDRKYKFQVISKLNGIIQYTPVVNYIELNDLYELSQSLIRDALAAEYEAQSSSIKGIRGMNFLARNDSNFTNECASVLNTIQNPNGYFNFQRNSNNYSTINSDAQLLASLNLANFGQFNISRPDQEEQWKVGRIKAILATSIRSIQRTNEAKANERKKILASSKISKSYKQQFQKTQGPGNSFFNKSFGQSQFSRNQDGSHTSKNMNTSIYTAGGQTRKSGFYDPSGYQSETSVRFSPTKRNQVLDNMPEFQVDSNMNNSQDSNPVFFRGKSGNNRNSQSSGFSMDGGGFKNQLRFQRDHSQLGPERDASIYEDQNSGQQFELSNVQSPQNQSNGQALENIDGQIQEQQEKRKKRKTILGFFRSIKRHQFIQNSKKMQVEMMRNELTKVFNLQKKFYISKQNEFTKDIKIKMEQQLDKHLKKKLKLLTTMNNFKSKIEYLADLIDFYMRHCDQESEHMHIITDRVIKKYSHLIPPQVIAERERRRLALAQTRMKLEQVKFQIMKQQQEALQQAQVDSNPGMTSDLNQTQSNFSYAPPVQQRTGQINFMNQPQKTSLNVNNSNSAPQYGYGSNSDPNTPHSKSLTGGETFKRMNLLQVIQLQKLKTKKMDKF